MLSHIELISFFMQVDYDELQIEFLYGSIPLICAAFMGLELWKLHELTVIRTSILKFPLLKMALDFLHMYILFTFKLVYCPKYALNVCHLKLNASLCKNKAILNKFQFTAAKNQPSLQSYLMLPASWDPNCWCIISACLLNQETFGKNDSKLRSNLPLIFSAFQPNYILQYQNMKRKRML